MVALIMAVAPRVDKPPTRRLVVVVDDDDGVREVYEDTLAQAGYEVVTFANGEDALAVLATRRPAVLVVDWRMPGLDGLEVVRRASLRHPRLPVLLVTGDARAAVAPARRADVRTVLGKPFDVEELVRAVATLATS